MQNGSLTPTRKIIGTEGSSGHLAPKASSLISYVAATAPSLTRRCKPNVAISNLGISSLSSAFQGTRGSASPKSGIRSASKSTAIPAKKRLRIISSWYIGGKPATFAFPGSAITGTTRAPAPMLAAISRVTATGPFFRRSIEGLTSCAPKRATNAFTYAPAPTLLPLFDGIAAVAERIFAARISARGVIRLGSASRAGTALTITPRASLASASITRTEKGKGEAAYGTSTGPFTGSITAITFTATAPVN